MGSRSSQLKF